jgi:hypothetical protein
MKKEKKVAAHGKTTEVHLAKNRERKGDEELKEE